MLDALNIQVRFMMMSMVMLTPSSYKATFALPIEPPRAYSSLNLTKINR